MAHGAMYGKIAPEMEEESDPLLPPLDEEESDDPVVNLARKAFPDVDWTPERASALENLIAHCTGGGDYEPPSPKGDDMDMGGKDKKATLLLALGGPKRK